MAIYCINHKLIYNEETKEIKKLYGSAAIKLTFRRARCLSYIIHHAEDEVIEKSSISQELWGERSEFTSDANINQTLYLVRRDLKMLGVEEFLITIPRVGIKVSHSVHIEPVVTKSRSKYILALLGVILITTLTSFFVLRN